MLSSIDAQNQVYFAAVHELEKLQQEMNFEKVTTRRRQHRKHALMLGSMVLVSLMSALATHTYVPSLNRPLSAAETEALTSLMSYVAMKKSMNDSVVQEVTLLHFNAAHLHDLQADDYDLVVSYLLKLAA